MFYAEVLRVFHKTNVLSSYLLGFALMPFLKGAGFGVPIAICAVLLVSLGFKPLQAAMLCLVANGASGVNKGVLRQPLIERLNEGM